MHALPKSLNALMTGDRQRLERWEHSGFPPVPRRRFSGSNVVALGALVVIVVHFALDRMERVDFAIWTPRNDPLNVHRAGTRVLTDRLQLFVGDPSQIEPGDLLVRRT